jgi:hypothetical protein
MMAAKEFAERMMETEPESWVTGAKKGIFMGLTLLLTTEGGPLVWRKRAQSGFTAVNSPVPAPKQSTPPEPEPIKEPSPLVNSPDALSQRVLSFKPLSGVAWHIVHIQDEDRLTSWCGMLKRVAEVKVDFVERIPPCAHCLRLKTMKRVKK